MTFEVPMFNPSNLQVRYLRILGTQLKTSVPYTNTKLATTAEAHVPARDPHTTLITQSENASYNPYRWVRYVTRYGRREACVGIICVSLRGRQHVRL